MGVDNVNIHTHDYTVHIMGGQAVSGKPERRSITHLRHAVAGSCPPQAP
jgi:hypothetical protein